MPPASSSPTSPPAPPLQLIAMHGWAGTAAGWQPWLPEVAARGWHWRSGERGYGGATPWLPAWEPQGLRVLISHSMGLHLLPPALLAAAQRVVLLAGFGRFVPPGRDGRPLRAALAGMAAALAESDDPDQSGLKAQALLRDFLVQAAAPDPPSLLPPGLADQPVPAEGRDRLRRDLALLEATTDLPQGFPERVPVLLVEAGDDRIVTAATRQLLAQRLPDAERLVLEGAGHAFLRTPPQAIVLQWLERNATP